MRKSSKSAGRKGEGNDERRKKKCLHYLWSMEKACVVMRCSSAASDQSDFTNWVTRRIVPVTLATSTSVEESKKEDS